MLAGQLVDRGDLEEVYMGGGEGGVQYLACGHHIGLMVNHVSWAIVRQGRYTGIYLE